MRLGNTLPLFPKSSLAGFFHFLTILCSLRTLCITSLSFEYMAGFSFSPSPLPLPLSLLCSRPLFGYRSGVLFLRSRFRSVISIFVCISHFLSLSVSLLLSPVFSLSLFLCLYLSQSHPSPLSFLPPFTTFCVLFFHTLLHFLSLHFSSSLPRPTFLSLAHLQLNPFRIIASPDVRTITTLTYHKSINHYLWDRV